MKETVDLYGGRALSNYIVVIPSKDKPSFIPDEFALVALESEEKYRAIRNTPEGEAYSRRHWDVFEQSISSSAKVFVNYPAENPDALVAGAAYDMLGNPIDWASGYNLVYIGVRNETLTGQEFLSGLKNHVELAVKNMGPQGPRGYIVLANEQFEVAYLN